jgi:hypothetical protein
MNNFINSITELVSSAEQALQTQFKIKPIKHQNLGILNSLILGSGIISILLFITHLSSYNPLLLSIELAIVSVLFIVSIWLTQSQYIHTLMAIVTSLSLFTWLFSISQKWSTIVFSLALLIILLFVIYFDLLKKNIVLQLTGVAILFLHFNRDYVDSLLTLQFPTKEYELESKLIPTGLTLVLFLPILYFAVVMARRTKRIAFSKIFTPIFHITTLIAFASVILTSPSYIATALLIALLITASILALKNHFEISFVYFSSFFVFSFLLIVSNYSLGVALPATIAAVIFPLITVLCLVAKVLIDKSFIDEK